MIALIMAGGIGSRFWPLSRHSRPKQFLPIVSAESMLRLTVNRLLKIIPIADIYLVTAQEQVSLVRQQIPELPAENIICEPFGMNTAPCIGLSLAWLQDKYPPEETMLVAAADHLITETEAFYNCLQLAENVAAKGFLVTLGIPPHYPSTSYGYIEKGVPLNDTTCRVKRFQEKPDLETATQYLQSGNFLWNSGMFIWQLQTIRQAFQNLQPQIWNLLLQIRQTWNNDSTAAAIDHFYARMPKLPIDIAIMEKADHIAVVPAAIGWSDVGGWKALAELSPADENGNFYKYSASPSLDSTQNYIFSPKTVSLIGVHNLIIVDTEDVLLVMDKERSEEVKTLVNLLQKAGREDLL